MVVCMVSSTPTSRTSGMLQRLVLHVASMEMNCPYFLYDISRDTHMARCTVCVWALGPVSHSPLHLCKLAGGPPTCEEESERVVLNMLYVCWGKK